MTTPNEVLLARAKRLRNELDDSNARLDRQCVTAMYEMDQALRSQAERIADLEADRNLEKKMRKDADEYADQLREKYNDTYGALDDAARENTSLRAELGDLPEAQAEMLAEIKQLRAHLSAIDATEPVAWRWVWKSKPWDIEGWCYTNTPPNHPELQEIEKLFTRPMPAESKDAERYRWLRDYLISPSTHFDDLIVSADKAETLNGVIDAAIAKGAK
jgi:hypothetical protein